MSMNIRNWAQSALLLAGLAGLALMAGCSPSQVSFDKEAFSHVKTVAVVIYTVPVAIEVREDPRGEKKGGNSAMAALKAVAKSMANTGDGHQAATLAQESFSEIINQQGLPFKALTRDEMMANAKFATLAREQREAIDAQLAKAAADREKKQGAMGKAIGFLSSMSGGSSNEEKPIGAAPDGMPSYGLVGSYIQANSALIGLDQEHAYLVKAAEALGVDAVMVINDPGFSWGCSTCINDTGNASTQSAFLVTMLDRSGKPILQMRQWFASGDGNAAMVSGVINPLQHDSLFKGHGSKTARVFADYYKEESNKK
jgi:hypothetical protein